MKTSTSAIKTTEVSKPNKKKRVILIIAIILDAIILIIVGLIAFSAWQSNQPHPLGDRLEYVGKQDYGYGLSDGPPSTEYYYATDMTVDEVASYFNKTELYKGSPTSINKMSDYASILLSNKSSHVSFEVDFYDHGSTYDSMSHLINGKKYIISINAKDYAIAKQSL